MLVESVVKRTLGLKSWRVKRVTEGIEGLVVDVVPRRLSRPRCSGCGRKRTGYDTLSARTRRHVVCWSIPMAIRYARRRVKCKRCGIKVEAMPWSMGKSQLTLPLIIMLATFAKILSWEEVSRLFGVGWNTVKAAVAHAVEHCMANRDTAEFIAIGVDELSRQKGHVYVTNVYDLLDMRLLWTGEERGKEVLEQFFAEWGKERIGRIMCICCDMWDPYVEVIKERAKDAVPVFDKFHIVQHLSKAVDQVRR